jgi:pyrophosphatase PpaX
MAHGSLKTFLFDLDGTLIDSVQLILESYRHTLTVHRGRCPPDETWLEGLGTPLWAQFRVFTEDPEEIDAMVRTYREFNLENHDALVRNFPDILDAVKVLHRRGVKLGIVTSKLTDTAWRGLDLCGFRDVFGVLVGADTLKKHKPDPAPVLKALELLESDPSTTVFVGDSPHDMEAGQNAGVRTAAALWGPFSRERLEPHRPTYWLGKPRELLQLT